MINVTYEEIYEVKSDTRRFKGERVLLGDRELARGRDAMGEACRQLIAAGHAPTDEIQAYWRSSTTPCWAKGTQLRQFANWVLVENKTGRTFTRVRYEKHLARIQALEDTSFKGVFSRGRIAPGRPSRP
jgi:hypothetical protein